MWDLIHSLFLSNDPHVSSQATKHSEMHGPHLFQLLKKRNKQGMFQSASDFVVETVETEAKQLASFGTCPALTPVTPVVENFEEQSFSEQYCSRAPTLWQILERMVVTPEKQDCINNSFTARRNRGIVRALLVDS